MLFRNLTLFRFPSSLRATLAGAELDDCLAGVPLTDCGPLELSRRGWVSPFGRGHDALVHRVGDCALLALGGVDKILPTSVVNEGLAKKLEAVREREGRSPGGRERKRLKEEVLTDLLPRAFCRPSRVLAYLDLELGWLVVDTASRKVGESVVTALREALGSFPALPVNAETSPRTLLTAALGGDCTLARMDLGDEAELRDPVDNGAIVKVRRQELDSDEIAEHLQAGKQCFRLALTYQERLSFVLGEDIVVRKLKFLETATEALDREERDSLVAEIDAQFALMSLELRALLRDLTGQFQLSSADA